MTYIILRALTVTFLSLGLYCHATLAAPLNIADFKICISASGSSYGVTCELEAGAKTIQTTTAEPTEALAELIVGRSGIAIIGNTTNPGGRSIIKRGRSTGDGLQTLLRVKSGVTNINVQNIDFDGR